MLETFPSMFESGNIFHLCPYVQQCSLIFLYVMCRGQTGHDLYGKKMEQFQRILSQLRAKDEEREVQALLDRQVWHFGGARLLARVFSFV